MGDEYRGLTLRTVKALKDLDEQTKAPGPVPVDKGQAWATGTAPRPDQTMRHPRTGEPLTPAEQQALMQALQKRKVPQAQ